MKQFLCPWCSKSKVKSVCKPIVFKEASDPTVGAAWHCETCGYGFLDHIVLAKDAKPKKKKNAKVHRNA